MKRLTTTYSILCFTLLLAFGLASCDQKESPADSISTENYPTVTVSSDFQGNTVAEGDTIMYTISVDKPLENPTAFSLQPSGGSADASDYTAPTVTFPAYVGDTTVTIPVVITADNVPEEEEDLSYTVAIDGIGLQKSVNPDSEFPEQNLTIENVNDPSGLTVVFDWNNPADDMDLFAVLYQGGTPVSLNQSGATGAKPETIVDNSGFAGTWYYDVNPYTINQTEVDYKFSIGYPDQSVDFFDGSFNFDSDNTVFTSASGDTLAAEPALGAGYVQLLKVTSTANASGANSFEVENLNPDSSDN